MDTSGSRDCQWTSRIVLKDFTVGALTISAGSLFQNRTVGGRKFCTGGENNGGKDREGSFQVNIV